MDILLIGSDELHVIWDLRLKQVYSMAFTHSTQIPSKLGFEPWSSACEVSVFTNVLLRLQ